jgi:putative NADPH-quinone reductase
MYHERNTMQFLIILAHPNPESLNHAIAHTAAATLQGLGHRVVHHDLCAEGFVPVLPVAEIAPDAVLDPSVAHYAADLIAADGIVVVHPNWWGKPPAILAGYIDRIFRPGFAYTFSKQDDGSGVPIGLLKAQMALVFTTSNTPDARERAVFGDPLEAFWTRCVFGLCGVPQVHRRNFSVVVSSTPQQRQAWLDETAATITHYAQQGNKE